MTRSWGPTRWTVALSLLAVSAAGCIHGPVMPGEPDDRFYNPEDRLQAISEAQILEPRDPGTLDAKAGPPDPEGRFRFPFDAWVYCTFEADPDKSGKTPKFDCRIDRVVDPETGEVQTADDLPKKDVVKVKMGADNGEVYAEVAGTRLLWLLGFHADAMYPVHVVCRGCPEDATAETGPTATRAFWHASIERKTPGKRMYEERKGKDQGWSWKELEQSSRAPLAHREALKLLAAFVVHGDNKPAQQRLVCDGVEVDASVRPYRTTCKASRVYIQDLGGTFGGGGLLTRNATAKMNLERWRNTSVWRRVGKPTRPDGSSDVECKANLPNALSAILPIPSNGWTGWGGLRHPAIGEEGRRLLAERLALLSDEQIAAIFRAARVEEAPSNRLPPGLTSDEGDEIIRAWVDVFREKRNEIEKGACRWKGTHDTNP